MAELKAARSDSACSRTWCAHRSAGQALRHRLDLLRPSAGAARRLRAGARRRLERARRIDREPGEPRRRLHGRDAGGVRDVGVAPRRAKRGCRRIEWSSAATTWARIPGRVLPPAVAMERAAEMVRQYVRAGYVKIHLDASMRCADDPPGGPPDALVASRTADLAAVAEAAAADRAPGVPQPVYVSAPRSRRRAGRPPATAGPAATSVADARAQPAPDVRGVRTAWARARVGAGAGTGGAARCGVRRRRRVPIPPGGRRGAAWLRREPGAPRVRGALDGLPGRGGAARAGRGPLRDPQGRPRADLRLPRGRLRARGDRARAAGDARPRPALRAARGARQGDARRPASLEGVLRRRGRADAPHPAAIQPLRPRPLLLAGPGGAGRPAPPLREPRRRAPAARAREPAPAGVRQPPARTARGRGRPRGSRASVCAACWRATRGRAASRPTRVAGSASLPL